MYISKDLHYILYFYLVSIFATIFLPTYNFTNLGNLLLLYNTKFHPHIILFILGFTFHKSYRKYFIMDFILSRIYTYLLTYIICYITVEVFPLKTIKPLFQSGHGQMLHRREERQIDKKKFTLQKIFYGERRKSN